MNTIERAKRDRLLLGYLESISWRVLNDYPEIVAALIRRRAGVYALYKQDRLYYVGLASNLMGRIRSHLKDRHAGRWDRFSVYITQHDDHVKQLESLLLRIVKPIGNRVKGGFGGSANLYRKLGREMTAADADRRAKALGGYVARRRRRTKTSRGKGSLVLAGLVEKRLSLKATHKGQTYKASLRRDGHISYAGRLYESPTAAAKQILKRTTNGWLFWRFKKSAGDWPRLGELRH